MGGLARRRRAHAEPGLSVAAFTAGIAMLAHQWAADSICSLSPIGERAHRDCCTVVDTRRETVLAWRDGERRRFEQLSAAAGHAASFRAVGAAGRASARALRWREQAIWRRDRGRAGLARHFSRRVFRAARSLG